MTVSNPTMPFEQARERFLRRTLTPREYLESLIEVSGLEADEIQAFVCLDLAAARKQADAATSRYASGAPLSPVDGMPIGVKDIIHTADFPTQMGSELYQGWQPRANAACVEALIAGGAIVLGKTHTTEFAIGRAAVTRNPHDHAHSPGGSSSGTAAGVAAGMICAGLGTQTNGSIIRPASYCGVVGYKPTWGLLPLDCVHTVSHTQDHLGVIAHSVDSAWAVAHCIMDWMPGGVDARLPGAEPSLLPATSALTTRPLKKVALVETAGYEELGSAEAAEFDSFLSRLSAAGIEVVRRVRDPALDAFCAELDKVPDASFDIVARDMVWPYAGYLQRDTSGYLSEKIASTVKHGQSISEQRYRALHAFRSQLRNQLCELARQYDAFILPSASGVAPYGLENTGSRTLSVYSSFLGTPAVNIPALMVGHLPMGVQLMGAPMSDYTLMGHAKYLRA